MTANEPMPNFRWPDRVWERINGLWTSRPLTLTDIKERRRTERKIMGKK